MQPPAVTRVDGVRATFDATRAGHYRVEVAACHALRTTLSGWSAAMSSEPPRGSIRQRAPLRGQQDTRLPVPGDHELLARPRACDEQQATLALQVQVVADLILVRGCDGCCRRDVVLLDTDDGDATELQTLHPVHRRHRDLVGPWGALGERDHADTCRGEVPYGLVDKR